MSSTQWRCIQCNTIFQPKNNEYKCPKCSSDATLPMNKKYKTTLEEKKNIPDKEVFCPKCDTKMIEGYMIEPDSPLSLLTLGANLHWSRYIDGRITSRIFLCTYACPSCGYTETYLVAPEELKKLQNHPET